MPTKVKTAQFITDTPLKVTAADKYGYFDLANDIAVLLLNRAFREDENAPFRVAVYGSWGSGKSSLLNLIKERIKEEKEKENINIVYFNPWEDGVTEEIDLLFIHKLLKSYDEDKKSLSEVTIFQAVDKFYKKVIELGGQSALKLAYEGSSKLIKTSTGFDIDKITPILKLIFDLLSKNHSFDKDNIDESFKELEKKAKKAVDRRTFIFIDDLDRCDAKLVVPFINTIKNVFDLDRTTYLFALDKQMISEGIKLHYKSEDVLKPYEYLEKIFDLGFALDDYRNDDKIEEIVEDCVRRARIDDKICNEKDIVKVFKKMIFDNPRQIVRFFNFLALLQNYYLEMWIPEAIQANRDRAKIMKESLENNLIPASEERELTKRKIDLNEGINLITLVLLIIYFKWNYLFYEVRKNVHLLRRIVDETNKDALMRVLSDFLENKQLTSEVFSDSTFVIIQDFLKEEFYQSDWELAQKQINMLEIL